jgi:hypothetical protein
MSGTARLKALEPVDGQPAEVGSNVPKPQRGRARVDFWNCRERAHPDALKPGHPAIADGASISWSALTLESFNRQSALPSKVVDLTQLQHSSLSQAVIQVDAARIEKGVQNGDSPQRLLNRCSGPVSGSQFRQGIDSGLKEGAAGTTVQ